MAPSRGNILKLLLIKNEIQYLTSTWADFRKEGEKNKKTISLHSKKDGSKKETDTLSVRCIYVVADTI